MTRARRRRVRGGLLALIASVACAAAAAAPVAALGSAHSPTPALGDWEATGAGGVPLSFALARRGGGVTVTALAVGFPAGCPVGPRRTLSAPVDRLRYAATPAPSAAGAGTIVLSGRAGATDVTLRGPLTGPRTLTLSTSAENQQLPCPWPRTETWQVHPAQRMAVADATWRASVTTAGLTGSVTVRTAAQGRVVTSLQAHYACTTAAGDRGEGTVGSTPAGEFISTDGGFSSPAGLEVDRGVTVRWSGAFSSHGALRGSFTDASACTDRPVQVSFAAARPLPRG